MHEAIGLCPVSVPVVGAACSVVSGAAGKVAGAGIGAVFSAAGNWVASGAVWLLQEVGSVMSTTTSVDLGAPWFAAHEAVMASLSAAVVLPMVSCAVIQAIYRQSASMLLRTFAVYLPLCLLFTGVAVELVRIALSITDALSARVLSGAGVDTSNMFSGLATFFAEAGTVNPAVPTFVVFVSALLVALAALDLVVGVGRACRSGVRRRFLPAAGAGRARMAGRIALVPPSGRHSGGTGVVEACDRRRAVVGGERPRRRVGVRRARRAAGSPPSSPGWRCSSSPRCRRSRCCDWCPPPKPGRWRTSNRRGTACRARPAPLSDREGTWRSTSRAAAVHRAREAAPRMSERRDPAKGSPPSPCSPARRSGPRVRWPPERRRASPARREGAEQWPVPASPPALRASTPPRGRAASREKACRRSRIARAGLAPMPPTPPTRAAVGATARRASVTAGQGTATKKFLSATRESPVRPGARPRRTASEATPATTSLGPERARIRLVHALPIRTARAPRGGGGLAWRADRRGGDGSPRRRGRRAGLAIGDRRGRGAGHRGVRRRRSYLAHRGPDGGRMGPARPAPRRDPSPWPARSRRSLRRRAAGARRPAAVGRPGRVPRWLREPGARRTGRGAVAVCRSPARPDAADVHGGARGVRTRVRPARRVGQGAPRRRVGRRAGVSGTRGLRRAPPAMGRTRRTARGSARRPHPGCGIDRGARRGAPFLRRARWPRSRAGSCAARCCWR